MTLEDWQALMLLLAWSMKVGNKKRNENNERIN
jgi:hypothetical protein